MKRWITMVLALAVAVAWGRPALAQDPVELGEAVERILAGEGEARGEAACDVLRSGVLSEVFGAEPPAENYRPGSKFIPHGYCSTSWDKPNREELDAARADYEMKKAMAKVRNQEFDEPMPPPSHYRVSLTIIRQEFDSPDAAVASLEATVQTLQEGVTAEVGGRERTAQVDFDGWIEGVGDRAAWAPRIHELQVAAAGVRYAITVEGHETAEDDKAKAIELAQRIAAGS